MHTNNLDSSGFVPMPEAEVEAYQRKNGEDLEEAQSSLIQLGRDGDFPYVDQDALALGPEGFKDYKAYLHRIKLGLGDKVPVSAVLPKAEREAEAERISALEIPIASRFNELVAMIKTRQKPDANGQSAPVTSQDLLKYGYKLDTAGNVVVAANDDLIPMGLFISPSEGVDDDELRVQPVDQISKRELSMHGYKRDSKGVVTKYVPGKTTLQDIAES